MINLRLRKKLCTEQRSVSKGFVNTSDVLTMQREGSLFMPNVEEVLLARISPLTCYTFHTLMKAVGKTYILQGQHPVTVLIPSDMAFEVLHEGAVYDLLKDIDKLEELLNFHLVPMTLTTSDVTHLALQMVDQQVHTTPVTATMRPAALRVETLSAYPLTVTFDNELQVNGMRVYEADIVADNGVVHILESILWPPGLSEASFAPNVQCQKVSSQGVPLR